MLDHLIIRVKDFCTMSVYYEKVLATLGYHRGVEYPGGLQLVNDVDGDSVWISALGDAPAGAPLHLAWLASGPEQVQSFYEAALEEGGTDNGAPGPRDYHPGYYACFVLDPEGNNIEAVIHDYQA